MNREYYENQFASYSDLLAPTDLARMLGVSVQTAHGLLWRSEIMSFRKGNRYLVPKASVIDFMLSEGYRELQKRVSAANLPGPIEENISAYRESLLSFCAVPRSKKEIMQHLGIAGLKTLFRLILNPLLETGELAMGTFLLWFVEVHFPCLSGFIFWVKARFSICSVFLRRLSLRRR